LGAGVAAKKVYDMSQLMPFKHPILTSLLPGPVDKSIIAYQNRNKWASYVSEMQKYAGALSFGRIAPMMAESAANVAHGAPAFGGMLSRGIGRVGDMFERGSIKLPEENQLAYNMNKFQGPGQTHAPMMNADVPKFRSSQEMQARQAEMAGAYAGHGQPSALNMEDMTHPQNYQDLGSFQYRGEKIGPQFEGRQYDEPVGPQFEGRQYDEPVGPQYQGRLSRMGERAGQMYNQGASRLGRAAMPLASKFPRIAGFLNGNTGGVMTNRSLGRGIIQRGLPIAAGAAFLGNAPFVGVNNAKANWQRQHPIQSLLARTFGGMPAYQDRSYFAPSFLQQ